MVSPPAAHPGSSRPTLFAKANIASSHYHLIPMKCLHSRALLSVRLASPVSPAPSSQPSTPFPRDPLSLAREVLLPSLLRD